MIRLGPLEIGIVLLIFFLIIFFFFLAKRNRAASKSRQTQENTLIGKRTIETKTVIIEEENKDKPEEILKKRLARGEITLEEFHQKIQRT